MTFEREGGRSQGRRHSGEETHKPATPKPLGGRVAAVRIRDGHRRKPSSNRWLTRQLNDPYVLEARRLGYRSRAAFKLIELDDRFRLFRPGQQVVDLGCAPGGWTQVAVERVGARRGTVVGIDLAETAPLPGAALLRGDIRDPSTREAIAQALGGFADIVLSDMAPPATGHGATDHLRVAALVEEAFTFTSKILQPGGTFLAKVFQSGVEGALLAELKRVFVEIRHAKPPASRAESAEAYVLARGFRGGA